MSYNSIEEIQSPKIQQKHPPVTTSSVEKGNLQPKPPAEQEKSSTEEISGLKEEEDNNIDSLFDTFGTVYV